MSSVAPKARRRILVAEDDASLLQLVSFMLRKEYDVVLASNGEEAKTRLLAPPLPDLLITDIMMPGIDGLMLVRWMKSQPTMTKIPVIVLTAKDGPKDVIEGINAGVKHYLTKPFKSEQLLEKVRLVLKK